MKCSLMVIAASALLCTVPSIAADWVLIPSNTEMYFDRLSVRADDSGNVLVWVATYYTEAKLKSLAAATKSVDFSHYQHTKSLQKINCTQRTETHTVGTHYAQDGAVIASWTNDTPLQPVIPDSVSDVMVTFICNEVNKIRQ